MKSKRFVIRCMACLFMLASCTEEMTMDLPEGRKVPVIEGSITNEYKRHEVVLSYTSEFYSSERDMISGAKVYVVESAGYQGSGDTVYFHEEADRPGHYLTDSMAGHKLRWYHLEVNIEESPSFSRPIRIYADEKMPNNASDIDSVGLLPLLNEEGLPFVDEKAAVCVCPYFQALADESVVYDVELYLNGKRFKNRPSQVFQLFEMQGYAGYYFNGPEMLEDNIPIPVGIMNKSYLHDGDTVTVKLCSITKDYMYFLLSQKLAIGVNPAMGAFSSTVSNIFSNCDAVGWFSTPSVISGSGTYHPF